MILRYTNAAQDTNRLLQADFTVGLGNWLVHSNINGLSRHFSNNFLKGPHWTEHFQWSPSREETGENKPISHETFHLECHVRFRSFTLNRERSRIFMEILFMHLIIFTLFFLLDCRRFYHQWISKIIWITINLPVQTELHLKRHQY